MEKAELLNQLRIDRGTAPVRSSRPLWMACAVLGILVVAVGLWFGFLSANPITVKTVLARSLAKAPATGSVLDASGYVTARRQATVSAKITGKVAELMIEEGQHVQEGQVLARLDETDARAQFNFTKAQLDAARSQMADLRVQLAQAQRDLQRQQDMVTRKLVSAQAVEQARSSVDSLNARLNSQQRQVAVAEQGLKVAEVNLDNTIVRAPFTGVIIAKAAQPGEIVSPMSAGGGFTRTGIGTIVDMDSLEVEVDVNESYIGRVQSGQPVEATLNAYPDWKIPAEVIAIIPTADRSKATVKVRIALKQKDPRIVPDMGARVAFLNDVKDATQPQQTQLGVLVPAAAIHQEGNVSVVFVFNNEKAQRRSVRVGGSFGDDRQILEGVRDGERVVVSASETIKDGDPIKLETNG